jgi:chlorobactene glucosyltransferase
MLLVIFFLACGLALWLAGLFWNWHNARRAMTVSAAMDFPLQDRPSVSILIPSRNEAEILVSSLPLFLEQDYENYEVILVDDASTDGTVEVAAQFLARYPERFRVCCVETLPPGWVGKSFALHTGFQEARGEWILATDADILWHPKALRAGLWLAGRQQAHLVSIFTFVDCISFWEKLLLPGLCLILATFFPFRKINDPGSSVALASGGYILMRRQVWAGLGGYENIRSEMIDDLNTARLVKHSGHRIFGAVTKDLLHTRMYLDFREIWEGLRKNIFAATRYSVAKLFVAVGGICLTNLPPLAFLCYGAGRMMETGGGGQETWQLQAVFLLSGAQYLLAVLLHLPLALYFEISPWYALLAPLGSLVYACIALDSMFRTLFGKGVTWKLRRYGKPVGSRGQ